MRTSRIGVVLALVLAAAATAQADTIYHVDGLCICEPQLVPGHPFEVVIDTEPDPPQTAEERALDLLHEPMPEPDVPDLWIIICRFVPFPPVITPDTPTEGDGGGMFEGEGAAEGGPSEGEGVVSEPGVMLLCAAAIVALAVRR